MIILSVALFMLSESFFPRLAQAHGELDDLDDGGDFSTFPAVRSHMESWLNINAFDATATNGCDIWGYTSSSGREYAIAGFNTFIGIVEITNPHFPVIVAEIPHVTSTWCDMKTYDQYLYVSNETNGGIQILDLTQIDEGLVTQRGSLTSYGLQSAHNLAVDERAGRLYVLGSNLGEGGILSYSLDIPTAPRLIGIFDENYVHDLQVVTFESGPYAEMTIGFSYSGGDGFQIIDMTDPRFPVVLSQVVYPGLGYTHQGWFNARSWLVYLNDELDELSGSSSTTTTRVFDVHDLTAPRMIGSFTTDLVSIDHNLMYHNGILYEANYSSGLRIFDARLDPVSPTEVGYFDTYPADDGTHFNGAWGIYAQFPSGTVIVSDINRGLFVISVEEAILLKPNAFELQAPVDLDVVTPDEIHLRWEKSWGALGYSVLVARDPEMHDLVFQVAVDPESLILTLDHLRPCNTYYWSVNAHNLNGMTSASNGPLMFYTGPHPDEPLSTPGSVDTIASTSDSESFSEFQESPAAEGESDSYESHWCDDLATLPEEE